MQAAILVLLVVLIVIATGGTLFARSAAKNSRWLQEVITPTVARIVAVVDPSYPAPPPPPPIKG
jgi:hypothetical protein